MACLQEWMVVVMCVVVYSKDLVVQADTQITVDCKYLLTCYRNMYFVGKFGQNRSFCLILVKIGDLNGD